MKELFKNIENCVHRGFLIDVLGDLSVVDIEM